MPISGVGSVWNRPDKIRSISDTSRSVRKTVERRKPWSVGPSPPQTCLAVWVAREGSRDKIQGNVTPSVTISPEFPNNTNSLQTRE